MAVGLCMVQNSAGRHNQLVGPVVDLGHCNHRHAGWDCIELESHHVHHDSDRRLCHREEHHHRVAIVGVDGLAHIRTEDCHNHLAAADPAEEVGVGGSYTAGLQTCWMVRMAQREEKDVTEQRSY